MRWGEKWQAARLGLAACEETSETLQLLEDEAALQHQRARTIGLRGDQAELGVAGGCIGSGERRMVHDVVGFRAKLEVGLRAFVPDAELLQDGGIELVDTILPKVPERRGERADVILKRVGGLG